MNLKKDKKTKIVATIGPATESQAMLEKLFKEGVDVVRMNFSHNTHEWHYGVLKNARAASVKVGKRIALLQDLSGPKIRTGELKGNEKVKIVAGKKLILTTKKIEGDASIMSINYKKLPLEVKKGDIIKIEDGKKAVRVEKTTETEIHTKVITGGWLGSRKGINVPGVDLSISSLTAKDKKDVLFGIEHEVDFIAFSFVQTKKDVLELRRILNKHKSKAHIVSKIETEAAVRNIDDIIEASDAIMIARGDMAIEVGAERVPEIQKMIINKCNEIGKPVVTATQMLDSMEHAPVPTRAEVSDIANALLDGTDAIMLSGETTIGEYPVEAVKTMTSIALRTEPSCEDVNLEYTKEHGNVVESVSKSAVRIANGIEAELIVTLTETGLTTRSLARYRPSQELIAITPHERVARQLVLSHGCHTFVEEFSDDIKILSGQVRDLVKKHKLAKKGEYILVTTGSQFGTPGSTNTIFVIQA